jgi:cytochrome o ubiquinol oxidase subunit 2
VVNQLVFPAKVPLSFRITSASVLTSFFIPQLGSQIYAMAGRQSRLHLMADEPGTYAGHNQQFSGRGYADMHFKAIAVSREQFEAWVQNTRRSPDTLDQARYEDLAKPSIGHPVTFYSSVTAGLFDRVIQSYGRAGATAGTTSRDSAIANMKTGDLEGR